MTPRPIRSALSPRAVSQKKEASPPARRKNRPAAAATARRPAPLAAAQRLPQGPGVDFGERRTAGAHGWAQRAEAGGQVGGDRGRVDFAGFEAAQGRGAGRVGVEQGLQARGDDFAGAVEHFGAQAGAHALRAAAALRQVAR